MQVLHLVEHLRTFRIADVAEAPAVAVEGRVPVDPASRGIDLRDRQQIGVLARQPGGNGGAQLAGGTPHGVAGQSQRAVALERFTD